MLIAQISDTHISIDKRGADNSRRLDKVVRYLRRLPSPPDLVVVSGDLTEDGEPASYALFRELIAPLGHRVLLAVGNHDRRAAFRHAFPHVEVNEGFVQYAVDLERRRVVVLDTLDEGQEGGAFCERRAAWLDATLAKAPDIGTLVVLHHPPSRSGLDWMDIHPDDGWTGRLGAVIRKHGQVLALAAGHVHRAIAMSWAGRVLTTTTSTAPQVALDLRPIDPETPDGRALIVDEPPGLAFHRWTSTGIATHFDVIDEPEVIVRFDDRHRRMIRDLTRTSPSP